MKVNREQAAQNRERILSVSSRLFREHGFDGIGVADLMKHAGLTHGGFYGHFSSKEDLLAQACERAFGKLAEHWNQVAAAAKDPLTAVTKNYLSAQHRDHPSRGCILAALGPDVSRQSVQVKKTFTRGFDALAQIIANIIPGKSKAEKRQKALTTYASFVGAIVLARAVHDKKLSDEILRAVATSVLSSAAATTRAP